MANKKPKEPRYKIQKIPNKSLKKGLPTKPVTRTEKVGSWVDLMNSFIQGTHYASTRSFTIRQLNALQPKINKILYSNSGGGVLVLIKYQSRTMDSSHQYVFYSIAVAGTGDSPAALVERHRRNCERGPCLRAIPTNPNNEFIDEYYWITMIGLPVRAN